MPESRIDEHLDMVDEWYAAVEEQDDDAIGDTD